MIGCYDFCGHYEWTFAWLEKQGGIELLCEYWDDGIGRDSQIHARALIVRDGIAGMKKYWQHTLEEEAAGCAIASDDKRFRIDMTECPSKGFLIRNNLRQFSDYCDHCIGWIGPMMKDAGYVVDHEHNHCGQCWWEFRREDDLSEPGALAGAEDVRRRPEWLSSTEPLDVFRRATHSLERRRISHE